MSSSNSSRDYAGDMSSSEAWALLKSDPRAQLIDVRTAAEWSFVGRPDLASVGREPHLIEWQVFPTMRLNPTFVADAARATGSPKDTTLLFLCRSGSRSRSAAIAMTAAGYTRAYNISDGFEGDLDGAAHRGAKSGWKASGLPWKQT